MFLSPRILLRRRFNQSCYRFFSALEGAIENQNRGCQEILNQPSEASCNLEPKDVVQDGAWIEQSFKGELNDTSNPVDAETEQTRWIQEGGSVLTMHTDEGQEQTDEVQEHGTVQGVLSELDTQNVHYKDSKQENEEMLKTSTEVLVHELSNEIQEDEYLILKHTDEVQDHTGTIEGIVSTFNIQNDYTDSNQEKEEVVKTLSKDLDSQTEDSRVDAVEGKVDNLLFEKLTVENNLIKAERDLFQEKVEKLQAQRDKLIEESILKEAERGVLENTIKELQAERDNLKELKIQQEAERELSEDKFQKLEAEKKMLKEDHIRIVAEERELSNDRIQKLQAERDALKEDNIQKEAERELLENTTQKLQAEKDQLTEENIRKEAERELSMNENQKLQAERDELTEKNIRIEAERELSIKEIQKVQAETDKLNDDNTLKEAERELLEKEIKLWRSDPLRGIKNLLSGRK